MNPTIPPPNLPAAFLFDMDGTITRPFLDFPTIKQEMGIGNRPILEALADMSPAERAKAEAILHRHEETAAAASTLNDGCRELLSLIQKIYRPTALITRNSRQSVRAVLERHSLTFDVLLTREDARHKPHPDPLHLACRQLNVLAADTWIIGDGQYDVEAGLAAGSRTVWLSHDRQRPFAAEPWRTVRDLIELTSMIKECL